MPLDPVLEARLCEYVDRRAGRLVEIIRDLVRIPSENTPPTGTEGACQEYVAGFLRRQNWQPVVYELGEVAGLREHPLFWPGREYQGRPNVGARRCGVGGGRSLLLSGHIDTVPRGTQVWTHAPFGGEIEGNRLYGRGSNDMKGGVGTNLFVLEVLESLGLRLKGDLVFETVVDEEFGGVNGTLAGRLHGFNAEAAIVSEPSFLRVCPAQRGGRIAHITFHAAGGILTEGASPAGVVDQLTCFLGELRGFAASRRAKAPLHEYYRHCPDPVPVSVMKVVTSPWGTAEPITIPESCKVELDWQAMPGEGQAEIEQEFLAWFRQLTSAHPELFAVAPQIEFPLRWLPGSALPPSEPLVMELAACAARVLGTAPPIAGIEGPCDLFVFHQVFGIPAVLWGARGGNTHAADEYMEIDSAVAAAKALLLFICQRCGVVEEPAPDSGLGQ
jgi:acetylornithine deacetylase